MEVVLGTICFERHIWGLEEVSLLFYREILLVALRAGQLIEFKSKSDFFYNWIMYKPIIVKSIFSLIRVNMYGSHSFNHFNPHVSFFWKRLLAFLQKIAARQAYNAST